MEYFRKKGLKIYEKLGDLGYNLEVNNLDRLTSLPKNPKVPFVAYFNHSVGDDPFEIVYLLEKYTPERLENTVIPISEHYAKFENHFAYASIVKAGRTFGFKMLEIVQSYRRKGESDKSKELFLDMSFIRVINENLDKGLTLIMSPEGHRSENGTLLPGEAGAGLIVSIFDKNIKRGVINDAYFVPFGIVHNDRQDNGIQYKLLKKADVEISIGEPISSTEIFNQATKSTNNKRALYQISSHLLMVHLTKVLPEEMWGFYYNEKSQDTILGRYEQRLNNDGEVIVFDNWERKIVY